MNATPAPFFDAPWNLFAMVHEKTGLPLTPEEIGEQVKNTVIKTAEASGSTEYLFVSADTPDGSFDICHIGNGPRRLAHGRLIAAAPRLLEKVQSLSEMLLSWHDQFPAEVGDKEKALISEVGTLLAEIKGPTT